MNETDKLRMALYFVRYQIDDDDIDLVSHTNLKFNIHTAAYLIDDVLGDWEPSAELDEEWNERGYFYTATKIIADLKELD